MTCQSAATGGAVTCEVDGYGDVHTTAGPDGVVRRLFPPPPFDHGNVPRLACTTLAAARPAAWNTVTSASPGKQHEALYNFLLELARELARDVKPDELLNNLPKFTLVAPSSSDFEFKSQIGSMGRLRSAALNRSRSRSTRRWSWRACSTSSTRHRC